MSNKNITTTTHLHPSIEGAKYEVAIMKSAGMYIPAVYLHLPAGRTVGHTMARQPTRAEAEARAERAMQAHMETGRWVLPVEVDPATVEPQTQGSIQLSLILDLLKNTDGGKDLDWDIFYWDVPKRVSFKDRPDKDVTLEEFLKTERRGAFWFTYRLQTTAEKVVSGHLFITDENGVGTGVGLTGNKVDVAIIDDPYKDAQQANSAAYRAMLEEWWDKVLMTRLHNNGVAI